LIFYLHTDSYVKSRKKIVDTLFEYLFANLIEQVALRIKPNFFTYTNKILINIRAKVHLDPLTCLNKFKNIYLKL